MIFQETDLIALREEMRLRLSEKRYLHTLAVEDCAVRLCEMCMPDKKDEAAVAALLHDIKNPCARGKHFS